MMSRLSVIYQEATLSQVTLEMMRIIMTYNSLDVKHLQGLNKTFSTIMHISPSSIWERFLLFAAF